MNPFNPTEWNTIVPILVALAGPYALKFGISDDALRGWLTAGGAFVVACWTLWSMINQKRVHETAIISGYAKDRATAQQLSVPESGANGKSQYQGVNAVKAIAAIALVAGAGYLLLLPRGAEAATMHVTHRAVHRAVEVAAAQTPAQFNAATSAPLLGGAPATALSASTPQANSATPAASDNSCPGNFFAKVQCFFKGAQTFTVDDLNAAAADAQAQMPPDTRHLACWQALATVAGANNQVLPSGLGLAQLIQKGFDDQKLLAPGAPWLDAVAQGCALTALDLKTNLAGLLAKIGVPAAALASTGGASAFLSAIPGL